MVGINLQPTAVRELTELGLGNELSQISTATRHLGLFTKFGQQIWREPRGVLAGYKWPQYSIHRGELQMPLLKAVRERIGSDHLRTGLQLLTFEQGPHRVVATFRDSTGAEIRNEADILVGADGIHSTVRRLLHPGEGKPRFGRQILWRAAVEAEPFLDGATMIIAGHLHQRIIVYPIGPGSRAGHLRTNWICQVDVTDDDLPPENWNSRATPETVLEQFGSWRFPWLDMPLLIARAERIYEFPLVDRDPVSSWTQGCVTLIGDAAHPMYPIGGQAGSQAVIDARVLASLLAVASYPVEALLQYEQQRRPQ